MPATNNHAMYLINAPTGTGANAWGQLATGDTSTPSTGTWRVRTGATTFASVKLANTGTIGVTTGKNALFFSGNNQNQIADTQGYISTFTSIYSAPAGTTISHYAHANLTAYVITSDGKLYGRGSNYNKQINDTTTHPINTWTERPHPAGKKWKFVSAASSGFVAIDIDGAVYAAGINSNYRLGVSNNSTSLSLTRWDPSLDGFTSIYLGDKTSAGIKGGQVYVWGEDPGNTSVSYIMTPTLWAGNSKSTAAWTKAVGGGGNQEVVALDANGDLWYQGLNGSGQAGFGHALAVTIVQKIASNVSDFAVGNGFIYYQTKLDGKIYSAGGGSALGRVSTAEQRTDVFWPISSSTDTRYQLFNSDGAPVSKTTANATQETGERVVEKVTVTVQSNERVAMANRDYLTTKETVYFVAANNKLVTSENLVEANPETQIKRSVNFVIDSNGDAWGIGNNDYGQLGAGDTLTTTLEFNGWRKVVGGHKWAKVLSNGNNSLGLTTKGEVYTWGRNNYRSYGGRLGTGYTQSGKIESSPVLLWDPEQPEGYRPVMDIALGDTTGYMIIELAEYTDLQYGQKKYGELYAWGMNTHGQIPLPGATVSEDVAGAMFPSPVKIETGNEATPNRWFRVWAGWRSVFVEHGYGTEEGMLYAAGANQYHQLGIPETDAIIRDLKILENPIWDNRNGDNIWNERWVDLSIGERHVLAIQEGEPLESIPSRIIGWGMNESGQLGFTAPDMSGEGDGTGPLPTDWFKPTVIREGQLAYKEVDPADPENQNKWIWHPEIIFTQVRAETTYLNATFKGSESFITQREIKTVEELNSKILTGENIIDNRVSQILTTEHAQWYEPRNDEPDTGEFGPAPDPREQNPTYVDKYRRYLCIDTSTWPTWEELSGTGPDSHPAGYTIDEVEYMKDVYFWQSWMTWIGVEPPEECALELAGKKQWTPRTDFNTFYAGADYYGSTGTRNNSDSTQKPLIDEFTDIGDYALIGSAGGKYYFGLSKGGQLKSWGMNDDYILARGGVGPSPLGMAFITKMFNQGTSVQSWTTQFANDNAHMSFPQYDLNVKVTHENIVDPTILEGTETTLTHEKVVDNLYSSFYRIPTTENIVDAATFVENSTLTTSEIIAGRASNTLPTTEDIQDVFSVVRTTERIQAADVKQILTSERVKGPSGYAAVVSNEIIAGIDGVSSITTNEVIAEPVIITDNRQIVTTEKVADQIIGSYKNILTSEFVLASEHLPTHEHVLPGSDQNQVMDRVEFMRTKLYQIVDKYGRKNAQFQLRSYADSGPYAGRKEPIAILENIPVFVVNPMMDSTWVSNIGSDRNMPEQFEIIVPYVQKAYEALYLKWKWQGNPDYTAYVEIDGRRYKLAYVARHEVEGQPIYLHLVVQANINNWDFNENGDIEANIPDLT